MKRIDRSLIVGAVIGAFSFASTLAAQGTRADTTLQRAVRQQLDTIARDKSAPGYSKRAQARIDSLMRGHLKPLTPPPDTSPVPLPPVARDSVTCSGRTCKFDAGASTGRRLTYVRDCKAFPNCASSVTTTFTYPHTGLNTSIMTVTDSLGRVSADTNTFTLSEPNIPPPDTLKPPPPDTIVVEDTSASIAIQPELPKGVPKFTIPPPTRTVRVPAPGVIRSVLSTITFGLVDAADLQDALDKAQPGDEIVLPSGAVYKGNYWLPTRACIGWVTVRSDAPLPAPGIRVDTITARAYAKLVTENNQPALRTRNPTCQWNLLGLEITGTLARTSQQYGLLWLGDGGWREGGETQVGLDFVPEQIVVDRSYIHGTRDLNITRCISLQSANSIIRDSFISECHVVGAQGQAIAVWNSPGLLLLENNFISGAGQNLLFGGADPGIDGLIPSDLTVLRNHFWKDPAWKGVYPASFDVESKNSKRSRYEGNVFENTWASAQSGMAIGFKSQSGNEQGRLMFQGTTDVTFRYNIVRCAQRGLNLQAVGEGGSDRHVARVSVTDNLFEQIARCNGVEPTDGWLMLLTHDLKDVSIARNTFVGNTPGYGLDVYFANGPGAQRLDIRSNIFAGQSYYAISGDQSANHTAALNAFAGSSWRFSGNVVAQVDQQFWGLNPVGNIYLTSVAQLGLRPDGSSANYPNVGVNVAELQRRTQGVVQP